MVTPASINSLSAEKRLCICTLLVLSLAAVLSTSPAQAHMATLSDREMVRYSQHVIVATVQGKKTHWNDKRTLILTDYLLAIEDRIKGNAPALTTVSVAGGTLDGETHDTCLSMHLRTGEKYLLFIENLEKVQLSPFTGAWQGVFRESKGTGTHRYVAGGASSSSLLTSGAVRIEFADFVDAVKGLVRQVENDPGPQPADARSAIVPKLPFKVYDPSAGLPQGRISEPLPHPVPSAPVAEGIEPGIIGSAHFPMPHLGRGGKSLVTGEYNFIGRALAPVVFNPLPPGFSWAPRDQAMMAYWNVYASNLFRVYTSSGTWAFGNNIFDITGFPDNAAMRSQFNTDWNSGALGITFVRGNAPIVEADIALNPYVLWTLDNELATRSGSNVHSFDHTMLHELGHAWGLAHPWETQDVWWDSVMNYAPQEYRLVTLTMDDANAVRAMFPGTSLHDGLISAYITQDAPGSSSPTYIASYPSSSNLEAGASFTMGWVKIENLGTDNLNNPSVDVYLTPQRLNFDGAIHLKTITYPLDVPPFYAWALDLGSINIPSTTPPGTYYVALFLRDSTDQLLYNNGAWTNSGATITVSSNDPGGAVLTSEYFPGFRFRVQITTPQGQIISGTKEASCIAETLCVSGSIPGRSEVFIRIVGPRPNGYLWPTLVKFTTSTVEIWVEQVNTGVTKYYLLEGATQDSNELPGLFDRTGFLPQSGR